MSLCLDETEATLNTVETMFYPVHARGKTGEICMQTGNLGFETPDTIGERFDAFTQPVYARADMAQVLQNQIFHFLSHDGSPYVGWMFPGGAAVFASSAARCFSISFTLRIDSSYKPTSGMARLNMLTMSGGVTKAATTNRPTIA